MRVCGKKRGFIIVFAIFLYVISVVLGGYCGNPASDYYCDGDSGVDIDDCCPLEADGDYAQDGLPGDQATCQTPGIYWDENSIPSECSDSGWCYREDSTECYSALQGECLWLDSGNDWDDILGDITECGYVCCEWNNGQSDEVDWVSSGFCTINGIDNGEAEDDCVATEVGNETLVACNDGVDNDGDGLTDYGQDPGCSATDDSSETDTNYVCDDGIDNDGDGDIDMLDTGCCDSTSSSEQLCELTGCGGDEVYSDCVCGDPNAGGQVCVIGNYCCNGLTVCQSNPCDSECSVGQMQLCYVDGNDLWYQDCEDTDNDGDYEWNSCYEYGTQAPELCEDDYDNDGDGLTDCDDLDCYMLQCDDSTSTCTVVEGGHAFRYNGLDVCCSSNDAHDCSGQNLGYPDTCGPCDCAGSPTTPVIDEVLFTQGEPYLTVVWDLACTLEFTLLGCSGEEETCPSTLDGLETEEEIRSVFGPIVSEITDFSYDVFVGANQRHCFVVEAYFDIADEYTYSDPYCVEDSGDVICQEVDDLGFCTASGPSLTGELTQRSYCDDENKHQIEENCDSEYYCFGPDATGFTDCVYQSSCDVCGDPLGMYGFDILATLFPEAGYDYCYEIPSCYFDYTETSVDWFNECGYVGSCYDYKSESSCTGQPSDYSNNKCLWRECNWIPNNDADVLIDGWCIEYDDSFKDCGYCNDAEHNSVFGACTKEKCMDFGDADECFLSALTGACTDAEDFSCSDYEDETDCEGSVELYVDVTYSGDDRIDGTHIVTASDDVLDIGLCRWMLDDGDYVCRKDADFNDKADTSEDDITPPVTTLITGDKVANMNMTFLAKDYEPDGSPGKGILDTWYCIADVGDTCYPDIRIDINDTTGLGYVEEGEGAGEHDVFYYSIDDANNLELIQSTTVEVDRAAPVITITDYVTPDLSDPYDDASVTFEVEVDENAYCTDVFEATNINEINNEYNNHFVVQYDGLLDGYYRYEVTCTDDLGNEGYASIVTRVESDMALFDPLPHGIIDVEEVELSVKTLEDANCGFSAFTEETTFSAMDQGFSKTDMMGDGYYLFTWDYSLEDNMEYWFDVKCELLVSGRESDDEIQFVFDNIVPLTSVVDAYGETFDFSGFYNGDEIDLYLECNDEPLNGFGCERTLYCVDTTICIPSIENDPLQPIEFNFSEASRYDLCYRSYENEIAGYGGLIEGTECVEIKIDSYDPNMEVYTPEDAEVVYIDYVEVTGEMDDPDATAGTPNNIVTIELINTNGETYTFTDIEANNEFEYEVTGLSLASNSTQYNVLNIYGTDRSGATTSTITRQVLYSQDFPEGSIILVEPTNGVTDEETFDFTVETFLDADECGYSRNNAEIGNSIAMTQVNDYTFTREVTIVQPEGVDDVLYVKCRLENGIVYADSFAIVYDTTPPVILDLYIDNSDGKNPPNIVEQPLEAQVYVETDDKTKCKYTTDSSDTFFTGMIKFDNYDDNDWLRINNHNYTSLSDKTTFTYYIQCANGASDLTDKYTLEFTVDTDLPSEFSLVAPGDTYLTSFQLEILTTRTSTGCKYGITEDAIDNVMSDMGDAKSYISDTVSVADEGLKRYYFSCEFAEGWITDYFEFYVDTTPPVVVSIDDGDVVYSHTQLGAIWNATDNLTGVDYYNVSVGTYATYSDAVNWTMIDATTTTFTDLNLTNQSYYYWNVYAVDGAGLWSQLKSSDGVFIDAAGSGTNDNGTTVDDILPEQCSNEIKDNDETDVDCGGDCDGCDEGSVCINDDDCLSRNCDNEVCQEATCFDQIINNYESDVDCGGGVCVECMEGQMCVFDNDCYTNYCSGHLCTVPTCSDNVQNGFEEGIDCGGNCPTLCPSVDSPGTCSDSIRNQGETGIDCGGPCSACKGEDEGLGLFGWLMILLIMILLGVGIYVGYIYWYEPKYGSLYDKLYELFTGKKRNPPKMLGPMGGLGRPSQGISGMPRRPGQKPIARPKGMSQSNYNQRVQQVARDRARQQKAKVRSKLLEGFEEKKLGKTEKLALKPKAKGIEGKITGKGVVSKAAVGAAAVKGVKETGKKPAKASVKPKSALEDLADIASGKPVKTPAKATTKAVKSKTGKVKSKPKTTTKTKSKKDIFDQLDDISKK
jgi:hypothetical protein